MAVTKEDIKKRLYSYFPHSWFRENNTNINIILEGMAVVAYWIYTFQEAARKELRIKTAANGILDLISQDFYDGYIERNSGESDEDFKLRILSNLLREKATRPAMEAAIEYVTGYKPLIIEPGFGYPDNAFTYDLSAYDIGIYGDNLPYQCFITVYCNNTFNQTSSIYSGYDVPLGAYDLIAGECILPFCYGENINKNNQNLILSVINLCKPAGTICWVSFEEVKNNG